ncbi:MAG: phage Gp37/Gp68 family protein [bacterium]|nr:phage Gp37/Gp68 family protein [bacterium]
MGLNSTIEWTESTWNPVTGCSKVSPGCKHCYAERMAKRLHAMGQTNYEHGFQISLHEHALDLPLEWKKPQMVFVNSMSDLFHDKVPEAFIRKVFDIMRRASWHTFQVLTKRAERMETIGRKLDWPANVWMGVSIETPKYLNRLNHLRRTPARVRFISFEPLLEAFDKVDLENIHWVIIGGESGPMARPMDKAWVTKIQDQCLSDRVPFFFKQWGGTNKKKAGRLLDGRTWDELPGQAASFTRTTTQALAPRRRNEHMVLDK